MKLYLNHNYLYAVEQMQLSLFPSEKSERTDRPFRGEDGCISRLSVGQTWATATASVTYHGKHALRMRRCAADRLTEPMVRQILKQSYYLAAVDVLGTAPPWGALSGVRPTKLTTRCLLGGGTPQEAADLMQHTYFVHPDRIRLCLESSMATVEAVRALAPQDVSLYIGIPFCPTRCVYCSFVSIGVEKKQGMLPDYLDALQCELRAVADLVRNAGKHIRTVYIGGGTPTVLSAAQLESLLGTVRSAFDCSHLAEFTVEGGRPDTLTEEKFRVLRRAGVGRVSINPQTMNDAVLAGIGRHHTAADIVRSFSQARAEGFDSINADLIAGLPGDTPDSFADSLGQVLSLAPENITVHTLARKKGSALFSGCAALPTDEAVRAMLDGAEALLREAGYTPYYLYRQKYMSGSFENVGWTKPGKACLYNIYMMEELHTILSAGSGGMTKVNLPDGKLARFHNPKFPQEYLDRIDAVCDKQSVLDAMCASE